MKRCISLVSAFLLVFSLCLFCMCSASAASQARFILKADRAFAKAGETINYTVTLAPCEHIQAMQVSLSIPDEFVYLEGVAQQGITETLKAARAEFSDQGRVFASFGTGDYSSEKETLLFSFSCKVADSAEKGKTYTIGTSELIAITPEDEDIPVVWDDENGTVTVSGSEGSVKPAVPASTQGGAASSSLSGDAGTTGSAQGSNSVGTGAVSQDGGSSGSPDDEAQTDGKDKIIEENSSDGSGLTTIKATADQVQGGGFPWIYVLIGIAVTFIAAVIIYIICKTKSKGNKGKETKNG